MIHVPMPSAAALKMYQVVCDKDANREHVSLASCSLVLMPHSPAGKGNTIYHEELNIARKAWDELVSLGWIQQVYRPCVQVAGGCWEAGNGD